jgi:hypothetical protein
VIGHKEWLYAMTRYELTNHQRKYFGLAPAANGWAKQALNETITVYFHHDKIVKLLNYGWGYVECDIDIDTKDRQILLPKTVRGKEQKLTVPRVLKIKGSGVEFSGSFLGGGINVYDHRRNLLFIQSFQEDGEIKSYQDIEDWISDYINKLPAGYFHWLHDELSQKRLKIQAKQGDVVAFKIAHNEYGFARILLDVFADRKKGDIKRPELYSVHPRSLIVAPYAHYADTLDVDIEKLVTKKTLPARCIFDLDVYRGEMPIVGHKPLSEVERQIPFPTNGATAVSIRCSKTDIQSFIATNGAEY